MTTFPNTFSLINKIVYISILLIQYNSYGYTLNNNGDFINIGNITLATGTNVTSAIGTSNGGNITITTKPSATINISGPTLAGGGSITIIGPVHMNTTGSEVSNIGNVTFSNPTFVNAILTTNTALTQITIGDPATSPGFIVINASGPITASGGIPTTGRCSIGSSATAPVAIDISNIYLANGVGSGLGFNLGFVGNTRQMVFQNLSSIQYKNNVNSIDSATSDAILKLQPVSFFYNNEPGHLCYGFIAEDVNEIPELENCVLYLDGKIGGLKYDGIFTVAVQKLILLTQDHEQLKADFDDQKAVINTLQQNMTTLQNQIDSILECLQAQGIILTPNIL